MKLTEVRREPGYFDLVGVLVNFSSRRWKNKAIVLLPQSPQSTKSSKHGVFTDQKSCERNMHNTMFKPHSGKFVR